MSGLTPGPLRRHRGMSSTSFGRRIASPASASAGRGLPLVAKPQPKVGLLLARLVPSISLPLTSRVGGDLIAAMTL
jgi:hypothetical protein